MSRFKLLLLCGLTLSLVVAVALIDTPPTIEVRLSKILKIEFLQPLAGLVQQAGGLIVIATVALLSSFFVLRGKNKKQERNARLAAIISFPLVTYLIVTAIKLLVARERPEFGMGGYGFVSLHSAISFYYLLTHNVFSTKKPPLLLCVLPLLVALSRVITGAHFVLDVVGGLMVGYLIYCVYIFYLPFQTNK